MTSTSQQSIFIVGAGQAGCEVALGLRQQGCVAPIALIGDEAHPPYQRPPLSKAFLKGEMETSALYLRQPALYEKNGIELMLNTRVESIDPRERALSLADGRELRYGKLALTTGGRARKLPIADAARAEATGNFYYLRSIADVLNIRERFIAGRRLVIVGGGYIGLEVAAAGISRGMNVTVLETLPRVLARVTAPQMSSFYERVHREAGVDVRTGVAVNGFEFDAAATEVTGVRCDDGSIVPADVVVVGIGLVPNVEVAQAAGLRIDNGIVVDEHAQTSDPDIVAAGDCTNHPSLHCGRQVRLESVPNAIEQARTAAATLAGKQRPHHALPWFWSDQYDLKLQMVGLSQGYDQLVVRGSMDARSFTVFYLQENRILACDAVNRAQEFMVAKRLVANRVVADAAVLADESAPLKTLAPAGN